MGTINPIVRSILAQRGIVEEAEIREFLADKPQKTYDPFLLPDLAAGVDLLLKAAKEKRRICIYGDYDADGITSVSILMEMLRHLTDQLEYYIPSRFDEGYGLHMDAVRRLHRRGIAVLVTVDCGSVSHEEVELAKSLGMDVLVTDHHSLTDTRADCLLINPKRPDCTYPFTGLAGCGVAFKVAQGIQKKAGLPRTALNRTLDLVALGTIADVVPLVDENRTLVKHGMHIISSGLRPGLSRLIESISLRRERLRADNIAFGIAPHLNAAGRMGDAGVAARLLMADDPEEIEELVAQLIACNRQRKQEQERAYAFCAQLIEETPERRFPVIYAEDIHEGIAGIVAGKLKDKYERPVILVTPSGEGLKGTGRSVTGLHLYHTLKKYQHLFLRFGGHEGACGFLMRRENLEPLALALEEEMNALLAEDPQRFAAPIDADLDLTGHQVSLELAEELEQLAPFGSQNPKPLFRLAPVRITGQRPLGDGTHIRFMAAGNDGCAVECVLFGRARQWETLLYGRPPVELIGSVDVQEWRDRKNVRFTVESIREDVIE